MKKLLLSLLCMISVCINVVAQEECITILPSDFGTGTAYITDETSATKNGITFGVNQINPSNGQIKKGDFYLYNKSELSGAITKVEITEKSGTFTPKTAYLTLGTSAVSGKKTSGTITGVEDTTSKIITLSAPDDNECKYFNLSGSIVSGTSYITNIKVYYKPGPITSCAAPTFSVKDGAEVYPGDVITFTCYTPGSEINYFKVNGSDFECESAGGVYSYIIPKDYTVGSTINLIAKATVEGENGPIESEIAEVTLNVVEKQLCDILTSGEESLNFTGSYALHKFASKETKVEYYAKGMLNKGMQINTGDDKTKSNYKSGIVSVLNPDDLVIESIEIIGNVDKVVLKVNNTPGTYTGSVDGTGTDVWVDPAANGVALTGKDIEGGKKYTPDGDYKFFSLTTTGSQVLTSVKVVYKPAKVLTPVTFSWGEDIVDNKCTFKVGDMVEFEELGLKATVADGNVVDVKYTLTSSNPDVVDIEEGEIWALEAGTATVTASLFDTEDTYKAEPIKLYVTVVDSQTPTPVAVVGNVEVDNDMIVYVDETITLSCPMENATLMYSVISDNDKFENIEEEISETNTVKINIKEPGHVTLTAFASADDLEDSEILEVKFVVKKHSSDLKFENEEVEVFMNKKDEYEGQKLTNPKNLDVTYSSEDPTVATVDEHTGKVTILKAGETMITASFAGNELIEKDEAVYDLTVSKCPAGIAFVKEEVTGYLDAEFTAPALVNPYNLTVTYAPDDSNIADVDEETGEVTLVSEGETYIYVSFEGNDIYEDAEDMYMLTVKAHKPQTVTSTYTFDFVNNNYGMTRNEGNDETKETGYNPDEVSIYNDDLTKLININVVNGTGGKNRLYKDKGWNFHRGSKVNSVYTSVDYNISISMSNYDITEIVFAGQLINSENVTIKNEGYNSDTKTWSGCSSNVDFVLTNNSGNNSPITTISVTFEHEIVKAPVVTVNEDRSKITLSHEDGHEIWYRFVTPATENAPLRAVTSTDSFTKYNDGEEIDVEANKLNKLELFAMHPDGIASETISHDMYAVWTGVENIATDATEEVWFNLQGVRVAQPTEGVYIRVTNGKAEKVAK